jgi:F-type H+-transporting ATPase subunit a
MGIGSREVFEVFGVAVTATILTTWGMVVTLVIFALVAGRLVREKPSRWQATLEWAITGLRDILGEVTGRNGDQYLPLVATVAIFVLVANLMSVLPFVESPTADVNTPLALAVIVFFSVHYFGIRSAGLIGYLGRFARPTFVLLPINILEHFTRTLSLAIRLFANMISHQIIVAVILLILPLVVPVILEIFGLFIGVLQAYIFTILTVVYLGGAVRAEGDE